MGEDRLPVHLGDTEIVDGVLVGGQPVRQWPTQVAVVAAATVFAGATIVAVGAAVVTARRRIRA
jgi:hypothetical protein